MGPDQIANEHRSAFITRWKNSGAAERANYQLFLSELCDLLGVERPDPTTPDDSENSYVFERSVTFQHPDGSTSTGRIDLYKRGCFVLEAKQGVEKRDVQLVLSEAKRATAKAAKRGTAQRGSAAWDVAMLKAQRQAEQYARALPEGEGRPPFLIVVDVGHSIELYSEFSRSGGTYVPYPDPRSHRLMLDHLAEPASLERLRLAWTDPLTLDPSRRSGKVTRAIAKKLALLAQSLEKSGHKPESVATFLMRALFTMFAEDVDLLPRDSFTTLLKSLRGQPEQFVPMIEEVWARMKSGGFSTVLREKILRFNGGLFEKAAALPLTDDQIELLIEASRADWREVEPAIFGTLLERALDPIERHRLGAHYTPRTYVERLVFPTIVEPLRVEWDAVRAATLTLDSQGNRKAAITEVQRFHRRLCELRILDPACGSGNFLYVTLEHLKRLEGEVLNTMDDLGHEQAQLEMAGFAVDPHQLLGLEVNPRAAAIAELVLWIGYLQWHFRTRGHIPPPEPVIRDFRNIECRDAILTWDRTEPALDAQGRPRTRWDSRTMKKHVVTGEDVPDDSARAPILNFINARPAMWPSADFIVGNPPFIGNKRMRIALGDDYCETLRVTVPEVPESSDFVMYWWHRAAALVAAGKVTQFGFITTNSVWQTFNRKLVQEHLEADQSISLVFAIPDHPWVDSADGAAVRIAMTVGRAGGGEEGTLRRSTGEAPLDSGESEVALETKMGVIRSDLKIGLTMLDVAPLRANSRLSFMGAKLVGKGFVVTRDEAAQLGLGRIPGIERHIRRFRTGRDLTGVLRDVLVIDLFGRTEEEVRRLFPEIYQRLFTMVKPLRDHNKDKQRRKNWWLHGRSIENYRTAVSGLRRYIATSEVAKFRLFTFLDADIFPDGALIAIAHEDPYVLGVLSSKVHVAWSLAAGGRLEDRPRYQPGRCFDPFPFPNASDTQIEEIGELAETLDAHRKRQLAQFPKLTLTSLYNVLGKVRAGTPLGPKEQRIHNQGLISVLRNLHDDLDEAVAAAYGVSASASDNELLAHLVALNVGRVAEESQEHVRWLRPSFQHPTEAMVQIPLAPGTTPTAKPSGAKKRARLTWPKSLVEQAHVVRTVLSTLATPADAALVAAQFKRARVDRVSELLATLASLGHVRELPDRKYVAT